jgi:hypothetical protein
MLQMIIPPRADAGVLLLPRRSVEEYLLQFTRLSAEEIIAGEINLIIGEST